MKIPPEQLEELATTWILSHKDSLVGRMSGSVALEIIHSAKESGCEYDNDDILALANLLLERGVGLKSELNERRREILKPTEKDEARQGCRVVLPDNIQQGDLFDEE
jgi:hypothetical protein